MGDSVQPALPGRIARAGLVAAIVALLSLAAGTSSALAGAWWRLSSRTAPSNLQPGKKAILEVGATNIGDVGVNATSTPVTITDTLPPNLEAVKIAGTPSERTEEAQKMSCQPEPPAQARTVSCTTQAEMFPPFEELRVRIEVNVKAGAGVGEHNEVSVQGGEQEGQPGLAMPSVPALSQPLTVNNQQTPFGVQEDGYALTPENEGGELDLQAGSHPFQLTTAVSLNETTESIPEGSETSLTGAAPALPKHLGFNLPPGLIGDPLAVHPCPSADFDAITEGVNDCPAESAIGVAVVTIAHFQPVAGRNHTFAVPLWNLEPANGEPARLGFEVANVPVVLDTSLRSNGDYGVTVSVSDAPETTQLISSEVTIWGAPGEESHNQQRGWACVDGGRYAKTQGRELQCLPPSNESKKAFLTLPAACTGSLLTTVEGESWPFKALGSEPGQVFTLEGPSTKAVLPGLEGCGLVPFSPAIRTESTEQSASTPTGLNVDVKVPQETTVEAGKVPAESNIQETTVTLPAGVQLNPSAANGLEACSEQQIGFEGEAVTDPYSPGPPGAAEPLSFSKEPANCPPASKVGAVRINTPLLEHELHGAVYLATPAPLGEPGQNPFHSLVALYIVAEEPTAGIRVKLAGESQLNGETGQITTSFRKTPQVPFEELHLELFGGPRASISTPAFCQGYPAQALFTPWSGTSPRSAESTFNIDAGPEGTPCPVGQQPFAPGLQAGVTNLQGGAFTSFTLDLSRPAADQPVAGLSVRLPPGNAAMLSSVQPCPEPQASQGTCGPESEIGQAVASSGLGPDPYTVTGGRVYITGPYDGAPFGLSIVTPAVAGPFNLGDVVVRSTININPNTAAVTISSGLPTFVQGIGRPSSGVPLQLRQIQVTVDRPNFEFNPTNCSPMRVEGTLTGAQGASAGASWPLQAANCASLPFKPTLTASSMGKTSKADGASLTVKVTSSPGQANIAKTTVTLPMALPSRLPTIQKACVARVFEANPASCPEGSNVGMAIVHTPVLKSALIGPAYLVSHGNVAFPDVEFVLQGEGITLVLDGGVAIKKGVTTSTFNAVPDDPVSSFEAILPEGPHSALTTDIPAKDKYSLCGVNMVMPTVITGQNGVVIKQETKVKIEGCGGVKGTRTKKLSRSQQLAAALKACRRTHKHSRAKRASCEREVHRRYAAKKAAHKRATKTTRSAARARTRG